MNIVNKRKGLLAMYGIKNVDIARKIGRSHITVSVVLTGKRTSRLIQEAIVRELNKRGAKVRYEELWPRKAA